MTDTEIERLTVVEQRSKSNSHRLDEMEKRQDNLEQLTCAVAGLQRDIEYTQGDVREIKSDVKSLMDVPKTRWNTIITALITAGVGGIIGVLIGMVF